MDGGSSESFDSQPIFETQYSPETIDTVLALSSLRRLSIENCEILPRHVERIMGHINLQSLKFLDCQLPTGVIDRLVSDRKMRSLAFADNGMQNTFEVSSLFETIADSAQRLRLIDCHFVHSDEVISLERFHSLDSFDAPDYAPNKRQLTELLESTSTLTSLTVNGKNLASLPPRLGQQLDFVTIHDAAFDATLMRGFQWNQTRSLSLVDSNLTDETILTWSIPTLFSINLTGANVTPEGVAALKAKWPLLDQVVLER